MRLSEVGPHAKRASARGTAICSPDSECFYLLSQDL